MRRFPLTALTLLRRGGMTLTVFASLGVGPILLTGCGDAPEDQEVVAPPPEPIEYPADY